MATTRIMPLHVGKGRTESRAISDIIDYVANPQKTDNGRLITGFTCDSRMVDAGFLLTKRQLQLEMDVSEHDVEEFIQRITRAKYDIDGLLLNEDSQGLRAVLLGKKAHTPRKKTVTQAEPPKVNLLVDIQAKLQAGKGAGYARCIVIKHSILWIARMALKMRCC